MERKILQAASMGEMTDVETTEKYYRGVWGKGRDRRKKSGFHREMAWACNEEHLPLIRSKRNKQALYNYSDFSYNREAEPKPDQLSWKHRCKKRGAFIIKPELILCFVNT